MKNIFKYVCLSASIALLASCNDFLDVQPKGQLEQDKMFQDLTGFEDAMFGIYGKMATGDLYGENLSWGLVDEIGQQFGYDNSQELAYHFNRYDYKYQQARSAIDKIWSSQYQAISYVNNVLEHADRATFAPTEIQLMKGECYGLRTFLHFDIARLFCNDYTRSNAATEGLPYATTFNLKNKARHTLFETYRLILRDLDTADSLLVNDNDISFDGDYQRDYKKGRVMLFNKYAVKATKARVYYAMGNNVEAVWYAREVIAAADAAKVATKDLFIQEMLRERMREFPGMGQTFYALKHYYRSFTDFRNVDTYQPSSEIFNLPWPDREVEYGDK